jgi:hypothetical protein
MVARPRVLARVAVWRIVAAQRGTALLADAQVYPARVNLHAFLALMALRSFYARDCAYVIAWGRHDYVVTSTISSTHMKPDVRRRVYQTKVSTAPSINPGGTSRPDTNV